MFSHWPIRNKLQLGLGLLAVSVLTLFGSAYYGLYAYRGLVKSLSARSAELPLAERVEPTRRRSARHPQPGRGAARISARQRAADTGPDQKVWDADGLLRRHYAAQFDLFRQTLDQYTEQLDDNRQRADMRIGDDSKERETLGEDRRP